MNIFNKLKQKEKCLLLGSIVFLGLFIYLYKLGSIPSGLYVDEALVGYNAHSLLVTGRDEYGKLLPVAFRFFGSYTPPLYVYLTVPFVSLFGLSVLSTRFLSAISGGAAILLTFMFLESLKIKKHKYLAYLGAILFAISPWNVFYARVGYEVYFAFIIFSLGVFLTWKALKDPKYWVFGLTILSVSTYAAHTQKFLVPIFIASTLIVFRKTINQKKTKKFLIKGLLIALIFQLPNIYLLKTPAFYTKSGMFYKDIVIDQANKITLLPNFLSVPLAFLREFSSQYFTYYSPKSLFFLPDPDLQRSLPELAVFYHWMIVPYLVGWYVLFRNRKTLEYKFLLLYLLICPLPTTLVGDPFSTQRALPLLLPMILLISLGINKLIGKVVLKKWIFIFVFLIGFSFVLLWRSYFVLLPKERAKTWGYGFKRLAEQVMLRQDKKFVIEQARIKPAYIELAFFLEYDPVKFQQEVNQEIKQDYYGDIKFNPYYKFANIETRDIIWEEDIYIEQILVGDELAISQKQAEEHFLEKVFEIRSPVDEIIFIGFKTNPEKKCKSDSNNIHCKEI